MGFAIMSIISAIHSPGPARSADRRMITIGIGV
jgi:hypothetical protein